MKRFAAGGVANAIVLVASVTALTTAAASTPCSTNELQAKSPADVTVLAARLEAATDKLPAHCFVEANVATPGNVVDFQLALPQEWNGKFLFLGVGGFAGQVGHLESGIRRGYASATTDTGHKGVTATDARWALNHRPREIDYGHRGTHASAVAAQSLTKSYYGKSPAQRYFSGCSNGGRQALMEAQRYPQDFDGIVAGDPSFGALGYVRRALNYQFMLQRAERVLPMATIEVLSKAVIAACDGKDGVLDGLVADPRACSFDPTTLLCKHAGDADCLSAGQVETVKFLYADVRLSDGTVLQRMPLGHEAGPTGWPAWITGRAPPSKQDDGSMWFTDENAPTGFRFVDGFFRYLAFEQDNPNYDWRQFDVVKDLAKITTMANVLSPVDSNLKEFGAGGKKLILYHGWADPALSAYASIDYFNKVVANAGGKPAADNFIRLFLAPGMHHCAGGPGPNKFDALEALEHWVEDGVAPDKIIATHFDGDKAERTRPLCPEPQVARYIGKGNIDVAENFRCE